MTVSVVHHFRIMIPAAMLLASLVSLQAQSTLQITSPTNGTVFSPGQTITVSVSASTGLSAVFIVGENPIGFSAPLYTAPYQFSVPLPTTIRPKQYVLTAEGVVTPGHVVRSTPITIVVQRSDSPTSLRLQPSVVNLDIGQNAYLRVVGTYSDNSTADLTQAASTTFVSNSPAIATVNAYGAVTAVSSGSTTILVNGTVVVPVTVAPAMEIAPRQKALYAGQSGGFYPTLANSSVPSVTWSISPPGVGSINSSRVYTAPLRLSASAALAEPHRFQPFVPRRKPFFGDSYQPGRG
jgi:hypothetical protein